MTLLTSFCCLIVVSRDGFQSSESEQFAQMRSSGCSSPWRHDDRIANGALTSSLYVFNVRALSPHDVTDTCRFHAPKPCNPLDTVRFPSDASLFSLARNSYSYAIARYRPSVCPSQTSVCRTGGSVKDG